MWIRGNILLLTGADNMEKPLPFRHQYNSPWNIAAQFTIDMSFSPCQIEAMLDEYEADYHTGMDTKKYQQKFISILPVIHIWYQQFASVWMKMLHPCSQTKVFPRYGRKQEFSRQLRLF